MDAVYIRDGPPGLGKCLFNSRPIKCGEVVLEEQPLLLGDAQEDLPPLASLAPLGAEQTSAALPHAGSIGGAGWPGSSACEARHMGLVLAFLDADPEVQCRVLDTMQHRIERSADAPEGSADGLPEVPAAAACCALGAQVLRDRGSPWLEEEWELPPAVQETWQRLQNEAGGAIGGGLLQALLSIFTVNAHSFGRRAALFDVATKLAHTCRGGLVRYRADPERGVGVFVAAEDIPQADTLLTTTYLSDKHLQCSTPQRRRFLYCQKGFICRCPACSSMPDLFRRLRAPPRIDGGAEQPMHLLHIAEPSDAWELRSDAGESADATQRRSFTDEDLGELLAEEQNLVREAMEIYCPFSPEHRLPDADRAKLGDVLERCERTLGPLHFAVQALRRLELAQQYHEIFHRAGDQKQHDEEQQESWKRKMHECEEYLRECSSLHGQAVSAT